MSGQVHLCTCNRSIPLERDALAEAGRSAGAGSVRTYDAMCQHELARLAETAEGDTVVACTQEARLLDEALRDAKRVATVRFLNVRERAGWSKDGAFSGPKIAALVAEAMLPEPAPTPIVNYRSGGQTLVVGPLETALAFAEAVKEALEVNVLATDTRGAALPAERSYPVVSGANVRVRGWLGAFDVTWQQANPIDLDACVRCHACVRACPEEAIGLDLQVDLDRCRAHRACVVACGEVGAIEFARLAAAAERGGRFDVVVNLTGRPFFTQHQPPQGYLAPETTLAGLMKAAAQAIALTGEFEKPRYFHYRANICAHGRNGKTGCTQCIDVCSTSAMASKGNTIEVTPELCMGCGACTSVCPSGALGYAFPRVADLGARLKTLVGTFHSAGGRDPTLLIHDLGHGAATVSALARSGEGLPAHCLPLGVHHAAAVGIDVWLTAVSYGLTGITLLLTRDTAPEYTAALSAQAQVANAILAALGYQDTAVRICDEFGLAGALWTAPRGLAVREAARWNAGNDKRATLEMAFDHLLAHAPTPKPLITLAAGSPFGAIRVDAARCTMCLACVGACPEGALLDNPERPELRFIESKCVQCGLCAKTCPESAIALVAQLDLRAEARKARQINAAEAALCTRCGKPLGAEPVIERMLSRLTGHSMFADPKALERLRMCADCRVIDLYSEEKPVDIRDLS